MFGSRTAFYHPLKIMLMHLKLTLCLALLAMATSERHGHLEEKTTTEGGLCDKSVTQRKKIDYSHTTTPTLMLF
jgi:hypothetical protein